MRIQNKGDKYRILSDGNILNKLEPFVYALSNPDNMELTKLDKLKIPEKIYGDVFEKVEIIKNSFNALDKNLGAWLSGDKGSGKTVTIGVIAKELNLPTIIVGGGLEPNKVCNFFSQLNQEIIVVLDEFDKFYPEHKDQEELLPLFDGVLDSKKLFLLSTNSEDISQYLTNRLGRIRYHFKYGRVSKEIRDEILENELQDKTKQESIVAILDILGNISIDNLLEFIKEVNISDVSPALIANYMNLAPEDAMFNFTVIYNNARGTGTYFKHPLSERILTLWYTPDGAKNKYSMKVAQFNIEKCDYFRTDEDQLSIEDDKGNVVHLTRVTDQRKLQLSDSIR